MTPPSSPEDGDLVQGAPKVAVPDEVQEAIRKKCIC